MASRLWPPLHAPCGGNVCTRVVRTLLGSLLGSQHLGVFEVPEDLRIPSKAVRGVGTWTQRMSRGAVGVPEMATVHLLPAFRVRWRP